MFINDLSTRQSTCRNNIAWRSRKHFSGQMKTSVRVSSGQYSFHLVPAGLVRASVFEDPSFFRDPSGCTAVAALVTADRKIIVVRLLSGT